MFHTREELIVEESRSRMEKLNQGREILFRVALELRDKGDESAMVVETEHACIDEHILHLRYGAVTKRGQTAARGIQLIIPTGGVTVQSTVRSHFDRTSWHWRYLERHPRISTEEQVRVAMKEKDHVSVPDTFLIEPDHSHTTVKVLSTPTP